MRLSSHFLILVATTAAPLSAAQVSFDWAYVGNVGNAFDSFTGRGAVDYAYSISKTEVTNAQYVEFLNAVDTNGSNTLALYNPSMAGNFGGIEATGATDGARYVAKAGRAQNPVTYVSFFDAMRFTNWLHNGQGFGGTESGAYTIGNGGNEVRSTGARYWIPSTNEWYKAAFHNAAAGAAGVYFKYATGSNSQPLSDQPGDDPAAVNVFIDDRIANGFNDGYAVSGSRSDPSDTNPFTDVGAYTEAISPYGTYDQNGNVSEWTEFTVGSPNGSNYRGVFGGSWGDGLVELDVGSTSADFPTSENRWKGFRVATVPEPSTVMMGTLSTLALLMRRRR